MKLNLIIKSPAVLSGYINVDPLDVNPNKKQCQLDNLSSICEAGEADEIRVDGVLDYFSWTKTAEIINHWISRLSHGGKLTIINFNANSLLNKIARGAQLPVDPKELLFGKQAAPWQVKKSFTSWQEVVAIMNANGLQITYKSLDDLTFVITGVRP